MLLRAILLHVAGLITNEALAGFHLGSKLFLGKMMGLSPTKIRGLLPAHFLVLGILLAVLLVLVLVLALVIVFIGIGQFNGYCKSTRLLSLDARSSRLS